MNENYGFSFENIFHLNVTLKIAIFWDISKAVLKAGWLFWDSLSQHKTKYLKKKSGQIQEAFNWKMRFQFWRIFFIQFFNSLMFDIIPKLWGLIGSLWLICTATGHATYCRSVATVALESYKSGGEGCDYSVR